MVTKDELDTWEADERAKPSADQRVLDLVNEVRRLRKVLAELESQAAGFVAKFAELTKTSLEGALENIRLRSAKLGPGRN
ncbi:unnamed protein product [marine sediment metagenome]|uniref:Uncharacterized protein n=1 Tax=marine sediment metagenome TaxID=412755 RepID=X0YC21_9ZZZZ